MTTSSDQIGASPNTMVWHGWGDPARRKGVPAAAATLLRKELGVADVSTPPVAESDVRMRACGLNPDVTELVRPVGGPHNVRADAHTRLVHAGGKSYPDLLRRRSGDAQDAPDAVVFAGSHDDGRRILDVCSTHAVAVVPFGGGTSVVGGVEPVRGTFSAVIALDLRRLDRLVAVDRD